MDDTARSSPLVELFPPEVAIEEGFMSAADPPELYPEEEPAVQRAVTRRRHEFATARACARRAMRRLGIAPRAIPAGGDRAPIWPRGIVGTITHTADYCAVALARADDLASLGLDVEGSEPMREELWRRITTEREQRWLERRAESERGLLGKLVFSAKEALYKCQYPLTRQFLGFLDVELDLVLEEQRFIARFLVDAADHFRAGDTLEGHYRIHPTRVYTALTLPLGDRLPTAKPPKSADF